MDKLNMKNSIRLVILLIFSFLFLNNRSAYAARVFFEPVEKNYSVEDQFYVDVKIDTEGKEINTIVLNISYPPMAEIKNISKADSLIQLWLKEPGFTDKNILLSGGIPGGIKTSSGQIARINFEAKAIGDGGLQVLPSSMALLNDGQGTSVNLSAGSSVFHILPKIKPNAQKPGSTPERSLLPPVKEQILQKKIKPDNFVISIERDTEVFGGQYFVSFFTKNSDDSISGIDHYEIKTGAGPYKVAKSPYLLSDQSLRSVIRVRAYNTDGNFRESVYPGLLKRIWWWITNLFTHKYNI